MSSKIILSSAFAAGVNGIMDFGDLYEPWPIPSENGMPLTLDGGLLNRAKDHGDSLVLFHAESIQNHSKTTPNDAGKGSRGIGQGIA